MNIYKVLFAISLFCNVLLAQPVDSVDVTFYYHTTNVYANVYLPGEFNGWTINNPISRMTFDPVTSTWSKTIRLRVGGPNPLPAPNSVPGAYQYKFHADGAWFQDPLNPRKNPNDNNNSYLFIRNPTIHLLLPNSTLASGIIRTRFPEITAYIFPSISSGVDLATIKVSIDGQEFTNIGSSYNPLSKKLSFITPNPLADGEHQLILSARSTNGLLSADSTTFTTQAGVVQFFTLNSETWKNTWRLQGAIFNSSGGYDTTVTSAQIIRFDSTWSVQVVGGKVDGTIYLLNGNNYFKIKAVVGGQTVTSDSINIFRKINHIPDAKIDITQNGSSLTISGASSSDPDGQQLTYTWSEDINNPGLLGINGITTQSVMVPKPTTPGEYYITLSVKDTDFNLDSTRAFFVVKQDSPLVKIAGFNDNPEWLKNGRVYLMFFKAFTSTGTILAAIPNLDYIKAMGFNIIWVLPVTEIPGVVDNQINIGYNIIDFLNVENSLGTNQDYQNFIDEAHNRGIKVIQDITPNHTGKEHPFAKQAILHGDFSQYWNYYQTVPIPHNTNGLGECVNPQGIYYYCGFSDVLLNYNWKDLDAQKYMVDVYDHWVRNYDIDGYRFDVYWGPHRKYGEVNMGVPVRNALKHIKPDILLLGEDDGVGPGTELLYADKGGGLDASYDFRLYFDGIRSFNFTADAVNTLHSKLDNNGYHPGKNSYYLRFMESQDEDRISYKYNSFEKTMPMATAVFMAPGMPMILNGQEVGFGKGMGAAGEPDLNVRRRGIVDWNFGGRAMLTPHYQKLAQIRGQFSSFSQHRRDTNGDGEVNSQDESDFDRVSTGNTIVYSFLRPYTNSNGLTVVNFSSSNQIVSLNLTSTNLKFDGGFNQGATYWVNDLYNGSSNQVLGSELSNFSVALTPYGSAIYTVSTQQETVNLPTLPPIVSVDEEQTTPPSEFTLFQNYPNPFNPSTRIQYQVSSISHVSLVVYDILGNEVATLVDEEKPAGRYEVKFEASRLTSGVYFYQLNAGGLIATKKMMILH